MSSYNYHCPICSSILKILNEKYGYCDECCVKVKLPDHMIESIKDERPKIIYSVSYEQLIFPLTYHKYYDSGDQPWNYNYSLKIHDFIDTLESAIECQKEIIDSEDSCTTIFSLKHAGPAQRDQKEKTRFAVDKNGITLIIDDTFIGYKDRLHSRAEYEWVLSGSCSPTVVIHSMEKIVKKCQELQISTVPDKCDIYLKWISEDCDSETILGQLTPISAHYFSNYRSIRGSKDNIKEGVQNYLKTAYSIFELLRTPNFCIDEIRDSDLTIDSNCIAIGQSLIDSEESLQNVLNDVMEFIDRMKTVTRETLFDD